LLNGNHDPALLDSVPLQYAHKFIQEQGIEQSNIEFEMLKGVTPERLQAMKNKGYRLVFTCLMVRSGIYIYAIV
jgi:hypothetical protein